MQELVGSLVLGLAIGVVSGVFGVGGSSISTPLLRIFLTTPRLIALASPLPMTVPTAVAGGLVYRRHGLINHRAVAWTVAGGVPAVVAGALLTRWVPGHWLMFFTAGAVFVVGMEMIRSRPAATGQSGASLSERRWQHPPPGSLMTMAVPVGLLSGLLANGGGFLLVPGFVLLFGASVRQAAATSLPCVAMFALPGTVTHALLGHVDGWLALQLSLGVMPGTYLGARASLWLGAPNSLGAGQAPEEQARGRAGLRRRFLGLARELWRLPGPGVITGASDDDPSGIATYSLTGAQIGYSLLWTAVVTVPLNAAIQNMCARIGLLTGSGLASALRRRYPRWVLMALVTLLLVANTANIGADMAAVASGVELLTGIPGAP